MEENLEDLVKTTTRGSLILLVGQVSSTLILAFGILIVARILGPTSFGSLNKAQSVVQIAILVMNLGVQQAMVRHLAQFRHEGKTDYIQVFIETGVLINAFVSVIFTGAVYLLSGFIANNVFNEPEQELFIKYLSIGIIGQSFSTLAQGITVGYERMELRSIISISYSLIKSIISPLLVYIGLGTLGAILGHTSPILLSGALGLFFITIIYRSQKTENRSITHLQAAKMILTYGFPLYLSSMLGGLLPQIYTTLLGIWETNEKIGNYSVALNFSVLLSFVTLPISTAIFPLFSKLDPKQNELDFLYRNAVKYSTLFGYPIIFTVIALADQIIEVLFQSRYIHAAYYLRIYMLSFLLIGFGGTCNGSLLSGQDRNDVNFKSTLGKFIVSLPLSYFGIQMFGVIGLLYIFLISGMVSTVINLYYIRRLFGFEINLQFLVKLIVISIVSCFVVYGLFKVVAINPWIELFIGGFLSIIIYVVGALFLKALTRQDFNYLRQLSHSFGPFSKIFRQLVDLLIKFS